MDEILLKDGKYPHQGGEGKVCVWVEKGWNAKRSGLRH